MNGRALLGIGFAAFLLFVLVGLPASVMVPRLLAGTGAGFGAVEGTVWQGALTQVSLGKRYLGRVSFTTHPLSVLALSPAADISLSGGDMQGHFIWQSHDGFQVSDLDLVMDVSARVAGRTLTGALRISGGTFHMNEAGRCMGGEADVRTNVLQEGFGIRGPMLAGRLVCDAGKTRLTLAGEIQDLAVQVSGDVTPGAGQQLSVSLTPRAKADIPESLRELLAQAGFSAKPDGSLGAHIELDMPL